MEKEFKARYWVWQAALDIDKRKASRKGKQLDTIRQKMCHDVDGVIVAYKREMDGESTSLSAATLGCQENSILDGVEGLTAIGYDKENVIVVSGKNDKVTEVTFRLSKDEQDAIRLTEGVNTASMSLEDFMKGTSSLNGVIGAPFFGKSLPLKRIFRDITLPRLLRETGYEVETDVVDKLDDALSYGLVAFPTIFPWIFEKAKTDHRKVTELALLLSHASAYLSVFGDMDLASLLCYRWMEVHRFAVNELDDEGYSYYYQKTN